MDLVRLYVVQDNRQWQELIPSNQLANRLANLEIAGATVEHASKLNMTKKSKRKQRTTLAGAARHLYA
jgi:hypothetical protein